MFTAKCYPGDTRPKVRHPRQLQPTGSWRRSLDAAHHLLRVEGSRPDQASGRDLDRRGHAGDPDRSTIARQAFEALEPQHRADRMGPQTQQGSAAGVAPSIGGKGRERDFRGERESRFALEEREREPFSFAQPA